MASPPWLAKHPSAGLMPDRAVWALATQFKHSLGSARAFMLAWTLKRVDEGERQVGTTKAGHRNKSVSLTSVLVGQQVLMVQRAAAQRSLQRFPLPQLLHQKLRAPLDG
jgi:hypothetical protein